MRKHGLISVILCICLLLSGCSRVEVGEGSNNPENDSTPSATHKFHLLYNETDSLNPYKATTKENKELCYLLFDPLITLDTNFEPIYKIAKEITLEDKVCTVTIKSVMHSDKSRLTADDVAYSALLAKESSTIYASQLASVESVTAANESTVVFTLKKADPFFTNMLDFPIIKKGSEDIKSEDNIVLPPIGAGRYVIDTAAATLTPNQNYYGGSQKIAKINLINAPGRESIDHYVSSGVVSMCYSDFSNNTVPQMSGLKASVPLNNLVFIGVNMSHWLLSNQYLRYAISSAVDRTELLSEAYYGNGTVAEGPFNPLWEHGKGFQTLENKSNTQISIVNLEKIGYNSLDSEGFRVDAKGNRLSLRLMLNSDNSARLVAGRRIAARLAKVGIEIIIEEVDYETYLRRLNNKDFELYLGEVRLLNNMDLTELVTPGGSAAFGIKGNAVTENDDTDSPKTEDTSSDTSVPQSNSPQTGGITLTSAAAVSGFYKGQYTIGDVASAFLSEMPIIPILYRSGIAMFTPEMKTVPKVSASELFIDINNYTFK